MEHQTLTHEFEDIYKKIENISIFGGYDLSLTRVIPNGLLQKIYKFVCVINFFCYSVLSVYGIYDNRHTPLGILLELGVFGAVITATCISYDILCHRKEYQEILLWVAEFHSKNRRHFGYLYEKAFVQSKKIIKGTVYVLAMTEITMMGFGCLIQLVFVPVWNENGKFNINVPYPQYVPWIPVEGWISFVINYVQQLVGQALMFDAYALFLIINSALLVFIGVHIDILGEYISRISDNIRLSKDESCKIDLREKIRNDLKGVIASHSEMTK